MRIISLSQQFNQLVCADPEFLKLAAHEQNFRRLDWISSQMEATSTN